MWGWEGGFRVWGWEGGFGVWGWEGGGQAPPEGQVWKRKGGGTSPGGGGPFGRRRHLQEAATQVRVGTAPRSMGAGGGRTVPGGRKSSGGRQWPRNPAPEGPARCPTTQCLGLRLGQSPAGALVELGMGEAPSRLSVVTPRWRHPRCRQSMAPGSQPATCQPSDPQAFSPAAPAAREGAQGVAEGTQAQETTPQRGLALPLSATPQLCDPGPL